MAGKLIDRRQHGGTFVHVTLHGIVAFLPVLMDIIFCRATGHEVLRTC